MKLFWIKIFALVITVMIMGGCRKQPQTIIQVQDRIVTKIDTLIYETIEAVPCEDFVDTVYSGVDTVYIRSENQKLIVKTVVKRDTVFRITSAQIIMPQAKKTKIDNSTKIKKSTVGDGNTSKSGNTTNKTKWFWIYVAGALSMFILQNVVWRYLKSKFAIPNTIQKWSIGR